MACHCCEEGHCHEEEESPLWLLLLRIGISLGLSLLGYFYLNEANFPWWVNLLTMGVAWLIISYDILLECFHNVFHEHKFFDESTLMIVASLGAFALRFFGPEHNEYLEGVLIMLLSQVGELFEDLASSRSRKAIVSALDLRKEKARLLQGGEKSPEALEIGDEIVVGAGEKILADGKVISGEGEVDASSLTGEFAPVYVSKDSELASGTLLKSGSVVFAVTKAYEDSTVAKLLSMVEDGAEHKSRATRFITKFARVYTPIIMALAVLVAVVPPLILGIGDSSVWFRWLYTALEFVVVSCPCAIVISVPLAYFAGIGLASRKGIIVKGAEFFDKADELKTICFDKTGTLTKGEFQVVEVHPKGIDEDTFLEYLSAVESRSSHPIAKAVLRYRPFYENALVSDYQELAGKGVKAHYKEHWIYAGKTEEKEAENGLHLHLIVDGINVGFALLSDLLRENSPEIVANLRSFGLSVCLLSGDKKAHAEALSQAIAFDESHAELPPEDKLSILREKVENHGMVAFVGDGINDAPSIALADIGFAMGGLGSDAAVANADVVLMNDDLSRVLTFLAIAKKTKCRAKFNTIFPLCVKFGVMIAAVVASIMGTWSLPIWAAVLADTGLSSLMVLSSLALFHSRVD